jgi:hypothetical protein
VRRLGTGAIDALTVVHKLVALAWAIAVILPLTGQNAPAYGRIALVAAGATLAIGLVYSVFSDYGFFRNRWMVAKWALFLVAGGALLSRAYVPAPVVGVIQLLAFASSAGLGGYLERSRHAKGAEAVA